MPTPWDYTTTPPASAAAPALSTTAPGGTNPAALSGSPPASVAAPALSTNAPVSINPAALTGAAPAAADPAALSALAPESVAPSALTTAPALPAGDLQLPLPTMPSAFTPAFIELTGGGSSLSTLTASAADAVAGRILQGTVAGELKSYQVRVGTDEEALPGIVRPANFDEVENAVVFVQC